MRYVKAKIHTENRETAYRIFLTDALKIIGDLDTRFYDLISDDFGMVGSTETTTESASDIISNISKHIEIIGKS